MAQLSKAAFLSKWDTLFADNSTRQISEADMRDFRQDIADSFSLVGGAITASTAGGTITLDFNGLPDVLFVGSASFATAKDIALANNSNALFMSFVFNVTNVAAVLTFPNEFVADDIRWDAGSQEWTPDQIGLFRLDAIFNGVDWMIEKITGPYL